MVDKENQWEDTENTMEEETDNTVEDYPEDSDDENYSDNEYEEYEDYEEGDEEENPSSQKKKSSPIIMILLVVILLGVIAFVLISKMGAGSNSQNIAQTPSSQEQTSQNMNFDNNNQNQSAMGDDFFNQNGGDNGMMNVDFNQPSDNNTASNPDNGNNMPGNVNQPQGNPNDGQDITVGSEPIVGGEDLFAQNNNNNPQANNQENNSMVIAYNKHTRSNPFKPPVVKTDDDVDIIEGLDVEIIEPPTKLVPDENLTKLLQTQISGILYDNESPSAIVNINGTDHFVKKGDTVSGYTIKDITRNQVMITYKNNSYVAAVGELFSKGKLDNQSEITNLENKFAGRYKH